jgi:hypothetical protein
MNSKPRNPSLMDSRHCRKEYGTTRHTKLASSLFHPLAIVQSRTSDGLLDLVGHALTCQSQILQRRPGIGGDQHEICSNGLEVVLLHKIGGDEAHARLQILVRRVGVGRGSDGIALEENEQIPMCTGSCSRRRGDILADVRLSERQEVNCALSSKPTETATLPSSSTVTFANQCRTCFDTGSAPIRME